MKQDLLWALRWLRHNPLFTESRLPNAIAEHRDPLLPRLIVIGVDGAP